MNSDKCGGIAQLARALGSYPNGRRFKSSFRYHTRPVGQAVKTRPFHGWNTSSILVRVTKKTTSELKGSDVVFLSKPQAWHGINALAHCMASRASVYTYLSAAWLHTRLHRNSISQQVADSIHGYAVIESRNENDMAVLEFSEQLVCEIAILCSENKTDSNTVYQLKQILFKHFFANISEA